MVGGLVMKPKTTNKGKTMIRPTKDMTKTMTTREQLLALLTGDDALRALLETTVQEVLEAEMDDTLGVGKGERSGERRGYRSGYYGRKLTTRVPSG
jgi:transposase-like protein